MFGLQKTGPYWTQFLVEGIRDLNRAIHVQTPGLANSLFTAVTL